MALTRLGPNQAVNLSTNTTGTLGVANGGTGLTSGTTDQLLKFTGSTTLASSAISTGKIGQVLQGTRSGTLTVNSGTYVTLGLGTAITPVATSSKILIMATLPCNNKAGTDNEGLNAQIYKAGSALKKFGGNAFYQSGGDALTGSISYTYLDSPSTTSSTEYDVFVARNGSSNIEINTNATNCSITLMEVLA